MANGSGINKNKSEIALNIIIVLFTAVGSALMFFGGGESGSLSAQGIANLKFYTVLSNLLCGVTITFAVVAFFFGPLYGWPQFYRGGNLYFHLLEPVAAMIEFLVIKRDRIPFRHTVIAAVPTLIYGFGYLGNILINGIGGPWPDTNDFYGFVNWGYPAGLLIFACITLLSFGVACIYRKASNSRAEA